MRVVLDTNVAMVADGRADQASAACEVACIEQIEKITSGSDRIVLDDGWLILGEYCDNLLRRGEPGVGQKFCKWVLNNAWTPEHCDQVHIQPTGGSFSEFPQDQALGGFDPSDRKFVAVVLAHADRPPVLNAVDPDWQHFKDALLVHGVRVVQLCPWRLAAR